MRKKLELTDSELLSMRESGMTNSDIANVLGVTRQCIYNHIGVDNVSMKNRRQYKPEFKKSEPEPEPDACLIIQKSIMAVGTNFSYAVRPEENEIVVYGNGDLHLKFEVLPDLIKELSAIERKLVSLKNNNEMW